MTENKLCSCCLSMECCKNLSDEYDNGKSKEMYADMLLNTFSINVNSYSCSICETCITKLRNATAFKAQVLETQETLIRRWNSKNDVDLKNALKEIDKFGSKINESFSSSNVVWDVETPQQADQVLIIEVETSLDEVKNAKDNAIIETDNTSQNVTAVSSNKKRTSLTKSGGKKLKRKSVTKAKNIKSAKKAKSRKKRAKTSETTLEEEDSGYGPPIAEPEIEARENTLKLIQNSNLCLFRSLKTKFGCFMCKASFVDPPKLREHSNTHTNATFLAYRVSKWRGLSFKNADISDLKCNHCLQNINNLIELINHLNEQHNIPLCGYNHFLIPYRLDEKNQCVMCELKFNTFLRLSMHMNSHYTYNVCEICGLPFINRQGLRMHVQSQHREKRCSFCPAKFLTVASKTKHLRNVHNMFNMKRYCNLCNETFPYTYMLDKHKIEEHGAKKIVVNCDECGKTFFHEANLRIHVRSVHIKERNYPCEVCGTRFFTKCDQRRHEKTHEDVRSFSCNYCDAKFKSKDSWRRHMKRQHNHVFK